MKNERILNDHTVKGNSSFNINNKKSKNPIRNSFIIPTSKNEKNFFKEENCKNNFENSENCKNNFENSENYNNLRFSKNSNIVNGQLFFKKKQKN